MQVQNAVSAVAVWRLNNTLLDMWTEFALSEFRIETFVSTNSLTERSCVCWMTELAKIDSRLSVCFTAVVILQVAYRSQRYGLSDDLVDILVTLCGQFICRRRYSQWLK